jgi:hypothetical protein
MSGYDQVVVLFSVIALGLSALAIWNSRQLDKHERELAALKRAESHPAE